MYWQSVNSLVLCSFKFKKTLTNFTKWAALVASYKALSADLDNRCFHYLTHFTGCVEQHLIVLRFDCPRNCWGNIRDVEYLLWPKENADLSFIASPTLKEQTPRPCSAKSKHLKILRDRQEYANKTIMTPPLCIDFFYQWN